MHISRANDTVLVDVYTAVQVGLFPKATRLRQNSQKKRKKPLLCLLLASHTGNGARWWPSGCSRDGGWDIQGRHQSWKVGLAEVENWQVGGGKQRRGQSTKNLLEAERTDTSNSLVDLNCTVQRSARLSSVFCLHRTCSNFGTEEHLEQQNPWTWSNARIINVTVEKQMERQFINTK